MKKKIILFIVVLNTMVSFAQNQANDNSSDHLLFMGIPIDGTVHEFTLKLEQKGFTINNTKDETVILSGDFAMYKDCSVLVTFQKQKDLVYSASVIFPYCNTWDILSSNYFSLKKMLTVKYGEPSESEERFQNSQPNDDNSKMYAVQMDRCKFKTTYKTEKGTILLSIIHAEQIGTVMLQYVDNLNLISVASKAEGDL